MVVKYTYTGNLLMQRRGEIIGKNGDTVLAAFARMYTNRAPGKIQITHPQAQTFRHP